MDKQEWFHREEVKALIRKVIAEGNRSTAIGRGQKSDSSNLENSKLKAKWEAEQRKKAKPTPPKKDS